MKKNLLVLCSTLLLQAQTTYTSSNYASGAYQQNYSYATTLDTLQAQPTGANYTWDFSTLALIRQELVEVEATTASNYGISYAGQCVLQGGNPFTCFTEWGTLTNIGLPINLNLNLGLVSFSNSIEFYKKTNSHLVGTIIGTTINTLPAPFKYNRPDTVLNFPLTYNQMHQAQSNIVFDLSPSGTNIMYKRGATRSYVVDGWGTLVTPNQTHASVLRMKVDVIRKDTVVTNGFSVPLPSVHEVEYLWFDSNYGLPVLELKGILVGTNTVFNTIRYQDSARCLTPSIIGGGFPLTADVGQAVAFNSNGMNYQNLTWSFGDGATSTQQNPNHTYTTAGTYPIELTACNTNCIPNQCDTFRTSVTIRSTVAVEEELKDAIKVYPNPSQEGFYIQNTLEEEATVSIFNTLGQKMTQVPVGSPLLYLSTTNWAEGVYILHYTSQKGTTSLPIVIQK